MGERRDYRIVILRWKTKQQEIEVFSNLKLLTEKYPQFNYNTLNNYLSKLKTAYDTDVVRIERKHVITRLAVTRADHPRKIGAVIHQHVLKQYNEKEEDLEYWLKESPSARVSAVTKVIQATKSKG